MQVDATEWLAAGEPVEAPPELEPPLSGKPPFPPELCFEDGTPNVVAVRAENRRRADVAYLTVFAFTRDHWAAATETCARYGHLLRGARCDRCGAGAR